jgi:hypothetical protein
MQIIIAIIIAVVGTSIIVGIINYITLGDFTANSFNNYRRHVNAGEFNRNDPKIKEFLKLMGM